MAEVARPASGAARKALELDDRLAEAYAAQAYVQGIFDWDWTGAEATIRRAIDVNPNSLESHYVYALLLMALGRLDEAVARIDRAAALDPLSSQVHSTYGRILYRARKYDAAIHRLNRAIELEPRNTGHYTRLGDVYEQIGRFAEALALFEKANAAEARPISVGVARVYARTGRRHEARQMLKQLREPPDVYVALRDTEAAFASLFKSVQERRNWSIYVKSDPLFDVLHADRRWPELLRRMNLPVDPHDKVIASRTQ
jgi:serine/threonine-protein kinase